MRTDKFDPDMTYMQTLRIIGKSLVQWPTNSFEVSLLAEASKNLMIEMGTAGWYIALPLLRLLALVLLPVSAPIFALLVQRERRRIAAIKKVGAKE